MYVSIGAQVHIKFLSPYASSTLLTDGQNLFSKELGVGNAALSLEYG